MNLKLFSRKQETQPETNALSGATEQVEIKAQTETNVQLEETEQIKAVTNKVNINRKSSSLDSKAEDIVFNYLDKVINTEAYRIETQKSILHTFKGVGLSDDLKEIYKNYCIAIDKPEMDYQSAEFGSFDFVIYDKIQHIPHLIIEVDGKAHATSPQKAHFDLFKKFVATHMFECPYISLRLYKSKTNEDLIEALRRELQLAELNLECNRPVFCQKCGRKMFYKTGKYGGYYSCPVPYYYPDSKEEHPNIGLKKVAPIFLDL